MDIYKFMTASLDVPELLPDRSDRAAGEQLNKALHVALEGCLGSFQNPSQWKLVSHEFLELKGHYLVSFVFRNEI